MGPLNLLSESFFLSLGRSSNMTEISLTRTLSLNPINQLMLLGDMSNI